MNVELDCSDRGRCIGPYRILGKLGDGQMGTVYDVEHRQTGERAALKVVRSPSEAIVSRMRREIRALGRIDHAGVVRVLDSGLECGMPWYAMERIAGPTLLDYARAIWCRAATTSRSPFQQLGGQSTTLPAGALNAISSDAPRARQRHDRPGHRPPETVAAILGVMRALCDSLACVHGEGIVHRDLKPANVLMRKAAPPSAAVEPVIVDFGVAADFAGAAGRERLTAETGASGTIYYMAPEQIHGELVDARADLYALGCILYELLTGAPPFTGATVAELVQGHLYRAPVPPSARVDGLPAGLDELVARLLEKDARDRYGYADDVAAALGRLGVAPVAPRPRPRAYVYRPTFVGRSDLFTGARTRLDALREGSGGLLFLDGESGVGKTRFATELARLALRLGIRVLTGECPPAAGNSPLVAFRGPLQGIADGCLEAGPEETRRVLGARGKVLAPYEPALAGLPGLEDLPEPAELPPPAARLRLFVYLAETLAAVAGSRPLLVVLDDLQWADELSREALVFFVASGRLDHISALLLGTYRTEEADASLRRIAGAAGTTTLRLERFCEEEVGELVCEMLAMRSCPVHFVRFLAAQSEGNPLFVSEYLQAALSKGVLYRDEIGQWHVAAADSARPEAVYASLPLPATVRELIELRLRELSATARELASAAAVIGRDAELDVVEAMMERGGEALLRALDELAERQVAIQAEGSRIRFVHDKIREVVGLGLAPDAAAHWHRKAATALEVAHANEIEEHTGALARHWEAAGEPERALPLYLTAARHARNRFDRDEAERLYRSYLRLAPDTAEALCARLELGSEVLAIRGRMSEAMAEVETALEAARRLADRPREAECLRWIGYLRWQTGEMEAAERTYAEVLTLVRAVQDRRLEGVALRDLAMLSYEQGRSAEGRRLQEVALALHRELGDRQEEGISLANLAFIHHEEGRLEEGRRLHEAALAIHRALGQRRFEGSTLGNLATVYYELGQLEEARRLNLAALAIHREVGARRSEGIVAGNLGLVCQEQGRMEEARECYELALAIAREVGSPRDEGGTLGCLAELDHLVTGEIVRNDALAATAERLLEEVGDRYLLASMLCIRGHLALDRGESSAPHIARARQIQAALGLGADSEPVRWLRVLERAQAAREAGDHHRLFRGRLPEDLTDGQRAWFAARESGAGWIAPDQRA
ncbi:MAG: tetratricopeptide repeat protein [Candidatus Schekmanbacteria bacterium]|nr:tetratricopeptide repeat protein [Candidatus Schekmanbacteria bacterium]